MSPKVQQRDATSREDLVTTSCDMQQHSNTTALSHVHGLYMYKKAQVGPLESGFFCPRIRNERVPKTQSARSTRKSVKAAKVYSARHKCGAELTLPLLVKIATWLQLTKGFSVNVTELRTHTNQPWTQEYKHSFSLSPLHTTGMRCKK